MLVVVDICEMSRIGFLLLFASLVWADERHGMPAETLSWNRDITHDRRTPVIIDSRQDGLLSPFYSLEEDISAHRSKRDIHPENSTIATKVRPLLVIEFTAEPGCDVYWLHNIILAVSADWECIDACGYRHAFNLCYGNHEPFAHVTLTGLWQAGLPPDNCWLSFEGLNSRIS